MATFHDMFKIVSDRRPTFHDVTDEVSKRVGVSGIKNGLVVVYSQHTSCSVFIQEQSDDVNYWGEQYLLQDLLNILEKIIPTCTTEGQYLHPGPKHIDKATKERGEEAWWSLNTDAHLRSVLLGRSIVVPLIDGKLELGEFGHIYFGDFDQTRTRERIVRICIVY
jgi:secondary thiamine-phosphate synthase enzyme